MKNKKRLTVLRAVFRDLFTGLLKVSDKRTQEILIRAFKLRRRDWRRALNWPGVNKVTKYIVSHHSLDLSWANAALITGDVIALIKNLKMKMDG